MFAKLAVSFVALASLIAAAPTAAPASAGISKRYDFPSFNNYNGYSYLSNFDNWYGVDDYSHSHYTQTVVSDKEVVCHSETVEIIQQRLAVLQEMAKRIITEQICEVESQTIVFQQYYSSLGNFNRDLRRYSGYQPGYDSNVISHYGDFYNSDGSLSNYDFGFSGSDVGSNTVVVGGDNWDSSSSPISVNSAYDAALGSYVSYN